MLTCTTLLKVKQAHRDEFERLLTALVHSVRDNEPGTTLFQMVRSQREPLTYLVIEQYADADALASHSATAYLMATVPPMLTYLTEPPTLDSFDPVA